MLSCMAVKCAGLRWPLKDNLIESLERLFAAQG
jgi:hypothetical protein